MPIALKINLSKIDKDRIFHGEKGKYIDVVVFDREEPDQYGYTHSVQMSLSKEEREQGVKPIYIGNGKDIGTRATPPPGRKQETIVDDYDGLPF